jgi:putative oxidoreductase
MKTKTKTYLTLTASILIFLWVYAAVSKLLAFELFKTQMFRQTLPHWLAIITVWTLPGTELGLSGLLLIACTRRIGFLISGAMLSLFTVYIILVLLHFFGRTPCSCGGVIQALGWKWHLVFNLFFLLLSFSGIYITNRERRTDNN